MTMKSQINNYYIYIYFIIVQDQQGMSNILMKDDRYKYAKGSLCNIIS